MKPLWHKLYYDAHYTEMARLIGYSGLSIKDKDSQARVNELGQKHGFKEMRAIANEIASFDEKAKRYLLTAEARKLCFQLLGPSPEHPQSEAFEEQRKRWAKEREPDQVQSIPNLKRLKSSENAGRRNASRRRTPKRRRNGHEQGEHEADSRTPICYPLAMLRYALFLIFIAFPAQAADWQGKVVAVADGDTITVLHGTEQVKIRLHGIDCPEKKQPFGNRAKQMTGDLAAGKIVTARPKDKDRYGRTVAEIILPDGKSLNHELVQAGLAWHFVLYAKNDKVLANLEADARAGAK